MSRETLLKEKQSLLDWIKKMKENNPDEDDYYYMVEIIREKIKDIEEKLKENNS